MDTVPGNDGNDEPPPYCAEPPRPEIELPPGLDAGRVRAIVQGRSKWVNGTVLHYHVFHGPPRWDGPEPQRQVVRECFEQWRALGLGLRFTEVGQASEAEVRIAFDQGDGSWSYLGRDVLGIATTLPTMNFGWDLTTTHGRTTALHEIGHTLGMPHEHQNPNAGIAWDEERVYDYFSRPPNRWPRPTTFHNIIRKLEPADVEGSTWDPESVMHYAFAAGLIREPARYRDEGIAPPGTLSAKDQEFVRHWYPGEDGGLEELTPFRSRPLSLAADEQADFVIRPDATRRYSIGTFGASDVVLVVFERQEDGALRYLVGDDDSGEDRNALVQAHLRPGREYVVRVRLYYAWESGETALMYW